jgi:hypothetical protein
MPFKGLSWNRSQKDVTLTSSDAPPQLPPLERANTSTDGSDPTDSERTTSIDNRSQNHLSVDAPHFDRDENVKTVTPRTSNSSSRPSTSRFSRFKLRHHSSDTQLATTAKSHHDVPPVPTVPPGMIANYIL